MDVIRHDDERIEIVALAVEMPEGVGDDARGRGLAKEAGAVAGVEPVVDLAAESLVVSGLGFRIPRLGMMTEPRVFFILPFGELSGGDGVGEAIGDEVIDLALLPVGETVLVDGDVGIRVEERRAGILPALVFDAGRMPALR